MPILGSPVSEWLLCLPCSISSVTSDPVTTVTNARAPSPRPATAKELGGLTDKLESLHIRPASLEAKRGNGEYRKPPPSPDTVPAADESSLGEGSPNPQKPADEDGDEFPLE